MLAFKPGHLTRRYVHGERARFVSPLALFLFTIFLMFATFSWLAPSGINLDQNVAPENKAAELAKDQAEIAKDITALEAEKTTALANGETASWIDGEIARKQREQEALASSALKASKEAKVSDVAREKLGVEKSQATTEMNRLEAKIAAAKKAGTPTAQMQEDLDGQRIAFNAITSAVNLAENGPEFNGKIETSIPWLDAGLKHAAENPALLIYKIQSNAYKFSWALIPLSVPFLWLLFAWRRQFKLFDHAVFITYSLCFMSMLSMFAAIFMQFSATIGLAIAANLIIPPIHMYKQVRYAYGTSRFGAAWRMMMLIMFSFVVLALFVMLIITLGVR
jgi:Protein of unknown function (DUF3667)